MRANRPLFRTMFFVALGVATAALTACSLVFSYDGYEGPAEGGVSGGGDSGVNVPPGSNPDAPPGAGDPDAACPAKAIFCDAFERDDPKGDWDTSGETNGTIGIGSGAPTGRYLTCTTGASADYAQIGLEKVTKVNVANTATLKMKLRYTSTEDASVAVGGTHASQLQFIDPTNPNAYSIVIPYLAFGHIFASELICVQPTCNYAQSDQGVLFTPGVWHDVTLTVDFTKSPATYHLDVDNKGSVDANSTYNAKPGLLTIRAGANPVDEKHVGGTVDIDDWSITGN